MLRLALLATSLLASGPSGSKADPKVVIELFQVALVDGTSVRYLRREAELDRRGPDVAVALLLHGKGGAPAFFTGAPLMVHSTSWRYEDRGAVVLTYLAYGEELNPASGAHAQTIQTNALPGIGITDPDKPRPPALAHVDVLAHGLRHLALLARRKGNDRFVERLGESSRKFFSSIEPELAGQIGDSKMLIPSAARAR